MECSGKTNSGNKCRKRTSKRWCYLHKPHNDECPVCMECDGESIIFKPCKHFIHTACCEGLISLKCPLCRSEITNWPDDLKFRINENIDFHHQEELRLEQEEIRRTEVHRVVSFAATPEQQIAAAQELLEDDGVDQRFWVDAVDIINNFPGQIAVAYYEASVQNVRDHTERARHVSEYLDGSSSSSDNEDYSMLRANIPFDDINDDVSSEEV